MLVKDIVVKWLKDNGYDGLASEDCGCPVSSVPACDGYAGDFVYCKPAILVECSDCNSNEDCDHRTLYDATECFRAIEKGGVDERTKDSNQR